MNQRLLLFIVGVIMLALTSCSSRIGAELGMGSEPGARRTSISQSIGELLLQFRANGSLVIRGQCANGSFIVDDIPNAPTGSFTDVGDALVAWSRVVPRLRVGQDANGMWRISDSTASAELLKVQIPDLRADVINGEEAIGAILASKPVISFLRDNGIEEASTIGGLAPYDESKLPHSTFRVSGVTVAEALDQMVKEYPGIWCYRECVVSNKHKFVDLRTLSFRK